MTIFLFLTVNFSHFDHYFIQKIPEKYAVYFFVYLYVYFLVIEYILMWTNEDNSLIGTQTWASFINQLDKHGNTGDQKGVFVLS